MCSLIRCFLRGGKYRFWFIAASCFVVLSLWQEHGRTLPTIVLLSPLEDAYFFPFLEVFLRRVLPEYEVTTLSPGGTLPPREEYIIVGFSRELQQVEFPQGRARCILLGEEGGVSVPLLGQVTFLWQETALAICRKLCAEGEKGRLFAGESAHPLRVLLVRLCEGNSGKPVVLVDRASLARSLLGEGKEAFSLVVLEATTEMLFALQEGKIDGVVDTRPSQVAQCIAEMVQGKTKTCVVTPLFVTQENISCADAYEVVRRCLSCH